jgi:hypothetical protein
MLRTLGIGCKKRQESDLLPRGNSVIEIDLNARVLTEGHSVYVVRPGKDYRLFSEIRENNLIALELPALTWPPDGELSDNDLRRLINRSRALRGWHRVKSDDPKPSMDLAGYTTGGGQSTSQLAGYARAVFEKMMIGDLVIVPPSSYREDALIGEIASEPGQVETIAVGRYFGVDELPGRKVRWIARMPKRELPYSILEVLDKPGALFLVERSQRGVFYKLAYGNYSIDDSYSARFDVDSPDFDTAADVRIQAFFNFVAANTRAIEEGGPVKSIGQAIFDDPGEYVAQLQTNINSPGNLMLHARMITPLVASILLVLAIDVGPTAKAEVDAGTLILRNSKAPDNDPCSAKVFQVSMDMIRLMNLDEWPDACARAQEAAQKTGLKSPAKVQRRQ